MTMPTSDRGTPERDSEIITLYRDGWLLKDIAPRFGMAPNSIGIILKRHGIERPAKPQKKMKNIDEAVVAKCWDAGLSTAAIAERLHVSRGMIVAILNKAGRDLSVRRQRYDGEGGTIDRSGGALARIARRA